MAGVSVEIVAAFDAFFRQEAAADEEIPRRRRRVAGEHFQRQPEPVLQRAAVAIGARVGAREEGGHRVGMSVVQFDAVEACALGAARGGGEQLRKDLRQVANVRLVRIRDALAMALAQRLIFARAQRLLPAFRAERQQPRARLAIGLRADEAAMRVRDGEEPFEIFRRLRASANGEKVDDLDQQARAVAARAPDGFNQTREPLDVAVVADAQQRPAGNVADAGRLYDDSARSSLREPLVPGEHVVADEALLGGAPRHHRRHPGALCERQPALG